MIIAVPEPTIPIRCDNLRVMGKPRILALFGSRVIFGAERENIEVLSALRAQGCEVLCLVRHEEWNEPVRAALATRGLATRNVPYIDGWARQWPWILLVRNPIAWLVGNWRCLAIARTFRPTHIHAFNAFYVLSFLPAILWIGTPIVYRSGEVPVRHRWIWRRLWAIVVRRTGRFLAVSRFVAGSLEASGVPASRIEVIYGVPPVRPAGGRRCRRAGRTCWLAGHRVCRPDHPREGTGPAGRRVWWPREPVSGQPGAD
jgi:hypothetical protein